MPVQHRFRCPPAPRRIRWRWAARIFHGQVDGGTCAGCHSPDDKGTAVGSDLADGHWIWGDGSIHAITQTIIHGVPNPRIIPARCRPKVAFAG